jgi:branched-chain amino acid aminotransferase
MDYKNLGFKYHPTDFYFVMKYQDGRWDQGSLTKDRMISISMFSQVLHYGQEAFEGLKAYTAMDGTINLFRPDMNAKRLQTSCKRLLMPIIEEAVFIDAVKQVVRANRHHVPPYGSNASLYIRPVIFGIGDNLGVSAANEYMFVIMTSPVGPYFKEGLKPVKMLVTEYDRAAPFGTGHIKTGGNYASSLLPNRLAKEQGYADCIYLDPATHTKIDEVGAANFFGITHDGTYVTPVSSSILPSITQDSLKYLAKHELGLNVEERDILVNELNQFSEVAACGTAASVTPIYLIHYKGKDFVFSKDDEVKPISLKLSIHMKQIQLKEKEGPKKWLVEV